MLAWRSRAMSRFLRLVLLTALALKGGILSEAEAAELKAGRSEL